MKITTFNYIVYGISVFIALILLVSSCSPAPCWCSGQENDSINNEDRLNPDEDGFFKKDRSDV